MTRVITLLCSLAALALAACASSRHAGTPSAREIVVTYASPRLPGTELELASLDGPNGATFRHHATGGTFPVEKGGRLPVVDQAGVQYYFKDSDVPAGRAVIEVRETGAAGR